jgi:hypothetical protein
MAGIITFIQENAQWVFGSGGMAALILGLLKLTGSGKAPGGGDVSGGSVGGDVVGGNKTVGFGALEVGLTVSLVVAAVGAVFWAMGPSNTVAADDCSAAVQGDGNQVTVTGGASCD